MNSYFTKKLKQQSKTTRKNAQTPDITVMKHNRRKKLKIIGYFSHMILKPTPPKQTITTTQHKPFFTDLSPTVNHIPGNFLK